MAERRTVLLTVAVALFTAFLVGQQVVFMKPEFTRSAVLASSGVPFSIERVCGSPAVDGYAHVDAQCLLDSPTTAKYLEFYNASLSAGNEVPAWEAVYMENTDIDGIAVAWGIGNTKASGEECQQACKEHKPAFTESGFARLPCNTWTWCAADDCWEPDAHKHSKGDCWLKFTEAPQNPEFNMRGKISEAMRKRHPTAPASVQWTAGVLLVPGLGMTNGSWGPRADW